MQTIGKVRTKAHLDDAVTELEKKNRQIALEAAREGIVLLENSGILPLDKTCKVALFGEGATNTVKGGSGSGEVNERKSTTIFQGMKEAGFKITTVSLLKKYATKASTARKEFFREQKKKAGIVNFGVTMANMEHPFVNPPFPALSENDLDDEAEVCIYVVSRISGEGYDRKLEKGDYYLSDQEESNIRLCASHYQHLILVINAGGPVDLGTIDDVSLDAMLFLSMLGTAGGEVLADVLSGNVSPSGHLSDTWVMKYEDIPCAREYSYLNGNVEKEYYKEDIYVGYRYFDTFDVPVRYPFGYGLSYTKFAIESEANLEGSNVVLKAQVTNTGAYTGKEVVQVYVSCPDGKLKKEYQRLAGFEKTKDLKPGEITELNIQFPLSLLASYDEDRASFLLEKGDYVLRVGDSSQNTEIVCVLECQETIVVSKHENICPLKDTFEKITLPQITRKGSLDQEEIPRLMIDSKAIVPIVHEYKEPEMVCDSATEQLMKKLKVKEMADIVVGAGNDMVIPTAHYYTVPGASGYTTYKYHDRGIKDINFCDGPAGIRIQQQAVAVKGKNLVKSITASIELLNFLPEICRKLAFGKPSDGTMLYQYTTAFPVGTALAQTWNTELVETVGYAVNAEMEEYGITYWLAPGMNIHRNPLCGRNYEYYSEDPLLTGKIAAAMTRGVQRKGNHFVTLKHFFCNNQETNRGKSSSEVSERAMREIYLKGFEIAVKEGDAKGVMTSYNRVNGVYSAVNYDAVTKVLRGEWGFDGIVMTDWENWKPDCDADRAIYAGMDLMMQGDNKQRKQIRKALKKGSLDEKYVKRSAVNVLRVISRLD